MSNAVMSDWPSGSANTGWPSEPSAMLMPGRVQGWPAGTQRASSPATTLLSQAVAWWDVEQYRDGDRFLRNRGTGGELLDLRLGSAAVANSNEPLFLPSLDQGYVALPGVANNFLSVPDEAALRITGDIDVRVLCAFDSWTPGSEQSVAGKYGNAGDRGWYITINTSGTVNYNWSSNGTASTTVTSSVATGVQAGSAKWVRVTHDVDNGASGNDVKFWLSDDGVSWSQLGTTRTTAGVTSIYASTMTLGVGVWSVNNANLTMSGRIYRAQVLNGIDGTTVLDIDCDAITSGSATSFTAVTNQTVTVNRSTSGRKSVAVPSRHKGGKPLMLFGTDDQLATLNTAWAHSLGDFRQGDSATILAAFRMWNRTNTQHPIAKGHMDMTVTDGRNSGWRFRSETPALFFGNQVSQAFALVTPTVVDGQRSGYVASYKGPLPFDASYRASTIIVGKWGISAYYCDMEFYGAAIWRRALTAAEATTVSNYYAEGIA